MYLKNHTTSDSLGENKLSEHHSSRASRQLSASLLELQNMLIEAILRLVLRICTKTEFHCSKMASGQINFNIYCLYRIEFI
jgi:hypothetical protein